MSRLSNHVVQEELVRIQREPMFESVSLADLPSFSFHENPVLVVKNFWPPEERQFFCEGMHHAAWKRLADLQKVREDLSNAGN
jgi:SM-20-related protein